MKQATLGEYGFPLVLALILVVVGALPYIHGYVSAGPDEVYMGLVGRDTTGANGYLMLARQAMEGAWLFENQMTPLPTRRAYFDLEWLLYGRMARHTGLSLMAVFHIWRVLTVVALLMALYYLAVQCFDDVFRRRLAVVLLCFGGGFGWLVWVANQMPRLDLPLPLDLQGVTLFGYLVNKPHFMRAALFLTLQCAFLIRGETTRQYRYYVYSGLAATALVFIRFHHLPESYMLYCAVPLIWCVLEGRLDWNRLAGHALACLTLLPATLYAAVTILSNVMQLKPDYWPGPLWLAQLMWLGLPFTACCAYLLCCGLTGIHKARKSTSMLTFWLLGAWLMAAAHPFFISGHEVAGLALMIAPGYLMLAVPGPAALDWLEKRRPAWRAALTRSPMKLAAAAALVLFCAPSSGYVYARMFKDLHNPVPPARYYLDAGLYNALDWLMREGEANEVVLSAYDTAQYVARLTNKKIVSGHDLLVANDSENHGMTLRFYQEHDDDAFKRYFVNRFSVRYVLHGPQERQLNGFTPKRHPWLTEVFREGAAAVYRVDDSLFAPQRSRQSQPDEETP